MQNAMNGIRISLITGISLAMLMLLSACENNNSPTQSTDERMQVQTSRNLPASPHSNAPQLESGVIYVLKASNARLNRKVTGEVGDDVMGIPAEPVHSFVWDGDGSEKIKNARATYRLDPVNNTGSIVAQWKDRNGIWRYEQTQYVSPQHPTGLQIGPDAEETILIQGDPVPVNVYLHGNTTAAGPVLPVLFNYIATWGPAKVTLNGEQFNNPYDGPAPRWFGHTMTTVGVRNADGEVKTVSGEFFNPMSSDQGMVDYTDMEFHLTWHDAPGPEIPENFPPLFSFFYHLTFEDVSLEVKHAE